MERNARTVVNTISSNGMRRISGGWPIIGIMPNIKIPTVEIKNNTKAASPNRIPNMAVAPFLSGGTNHDPNKLRSDENEAHQIEAIGNEFFISLKKSPYRRNVHLVSPL
jgi:hypothetical protein